MLGDQRNKLRARLRRERNLRGTDSPHPAEERHLHSQPGRGKQSHVMAKRLDAFEWDRRRQLIIVSHSRFIALLLTYRPGLNTPAAGLIYSGTTLSNVIGIIFERI